MGVFGHIMKFILIALVVVLVVVIIAAAAMFLFPSFKLFGYHYIKSDVNASSYQFLKGDDAKAEEAWNKADIIRIETGAYNVEFRYATSNMLLDSGDIMVNIEGTYRGFVKGSVDRPTYSSTESIFDVNNEDEEHAYYKDELRPDKKIYFIKMAEPEKGFLMRNGTKLLFTMTYDIFSNKDVEIVTNSGTIRFGAENTMSLNNLSIQSSSGAVYLGDIKVNTHIESGIEKPGNIIIKKSKKGTVVAQNNLKANVDIQVSGGGDEITLKDIESVSNDALSKLNIESHNSTVTVGNVNGDFSCNTNGAKMNVGNITGTAMLQIKETTSNFKTIGKVAKQNTLSIVANGKTSISFEKVLNNIDISKNANTKITIDESYGNVTYKGEKGSLDLKKIHASKITIVETKGSIELNCCKEEKVDIVSTATGGRITFSGVELGIVEINKDNEQSSCSIYGTFEKVIGKHTIKTTSGKVNITAVQNDDYSLSWLAKYANMNIFGNLKTTIWSSEEYCKSKGSTYTSTNAYGEPCQENTLNSLTLWATSGEVTVSAI